MALLATQSITRLGLTQALAAPSASDTFVPGARTFYIAVIGATATTFTFIAPTARDVIPNVDIANLVSGPYSNVTKIIGAFPPEVFGDPVTGLVTVTTSNQTAVTVGVFDLSYS